ncbi:MAG: hypothetical protein IPO15_04975 [Anaerolineae bacterium]|nr:hypothetical protein [Anaerolineae bacterium]
MFRQIEMLVASTNLILGSNTSSPPITEIARALGYPGRAIGYSHFFNPAPLMDPRFEIIPARTRHLAVLSLRWKRSYCQVGKDPAVIKPAIIRGRSLAFISG